MADKPRHAQRPLSLLPRVPRWVLCAKDSTTVATEGNKMLYRFPQYVINVHYEPLSSDVMKVGHQELFINVSE